MAITINGTTGIAGVDGSAATPAVQGADTNTGVFYPAADTVGVSTGGSERVRVDSSGNVGIGTASPSGKLNVISGSVAQLIIGFSATSASYLDSDLIVFRNAASAERMRIDSSGGLILAGSTAQKATGTTWSNPSDQRLKSNIQDYTKGTAELMQVRVREWEYNGKGGTTEGMKGLGVVADEVMTVLPDTVETYDAKLNADDEEKTAIKKFDATEITWLLVKTVQEQQALITQLQADVAALKGTP